MVARTVVWLRRDLRIEDNPALFTAAQIGTVIPVFIWSPEEEGQFYPGRVSRWWLKKSLAQLNDSLKSLGTSILMKRAKCSLTALLEIFQASKATQIFYNHLYDPMSLLRDYKVKQGLGAYGIPVRTFNADLLFEPWEVNDDNGQAFTLFNRFWNKCFNLPFAPDPPLPTPHKINGPQVPLPSLTIEDLGLENEQEKASNALLAREWMPGWVNADNLLLYFVSGTLKKYASRMEQTDSEGSSTSLLSPHIHFGEISVRKIYQEVCKAKAQWQKSGDHPGGPASADLFVRSLGLREYSRYLSFNFPFTYERSLLSNLKFFPWRADEALFKAWRLGRTGYPLVDAAMRQLWATGWLHVRLRVTTASFCVKFLRLPWRWGLMYFWDTLLDADLESDVLGWQFISGSLPDGHELDRMDSPWEEGQRFDPTGDYVRRWLPELSRLPSEWVHQPWEAPAAVLSAAGVDLGCNYPLPVVDAQEARERLQEAVQYMWEGAAAERAVWANQGEEGEGSWTGGEVAVERSSKRFVYRDQMVPTGSRTSSLPDAGFSEAQGTAPLPSTSSAAEPDSGVRGVPLGLGAGREGQEEKQGEVQLGVQAEPGTPGLRQQDPAVPAAFFQPGQWLFFRGGMARRSSAEEAGDSSAESTSPLQRRRDPEQVQSEEVEVQYPLHRGPTRFAAAPVEEQSRSLSLSAGWTSESMPNSESVPFSEPPVPRDAEAGTAAETTSGVAASVQVPGEEEEGADSAPGRSQEQSRGRGRVREGSGGSGSAGAGQSTRRMRDDTSAAESKETSNASMKRPKRPEEADIRISSPSS